MVTPDVLDPQPKYLVYNLVLAGTRSQVVQGYVEFDDPIGRSALKLMLNPLGHREFRPATPQEIRQYSMEY